MRIRAVGTGLVVAAALAVVGPAAAGSGARVPVLEVTKTGLTAKEAAALGTALGIDVPVEVLEDGSVHHVDDARYLAVPTLSLGEGPPDEEGVPTVRTEVDLTALQQLTPVSPDVAAALARRALVDTRLIGATARYTTGHATFGSVPMDESPGAVARIDTQVVVEERVTSRRIPIVGPGAKIKLNVAPDGEIAKLLYNRRALRAGTQVRLLSKAAGIAACRAAYPARSSAATRRTEAWTSSDLRIGTSLVYYAPELAIRANRIVPHLRCAARAPVGERLIDLPRAYVPATADPRVVPTAKLTTRVQNGRFVASVEVTGGRAPYTLAWNSSSTTFPASITDRTRSAAIGYQVTGTALGAPAGIVSVSVTDANGIEVTTSAIETATRTAAPSAPARPRPASRVLAAAGIDVATEWIGTSQGLNYSRRNTRGFVDTMRASGATVRFDYGDEAAWQRDFTPVALGGEDSDWIDNVDLAYWVGNTIRPDVWPAVGGSPGCDYPNNSACANPFEFGREALLFESSTDSTELRWRSAPSPNMLANIPAVPGGMDLGNGDLEWIVLAGPWLFEHVPTQIERVPGAPGGYSTFPPGFTLPHQWGSVFDGLHGLYGYTNVPTHSGRLTGEKFAGHLHGRVGLFGIRTGVRTVSDAWFLACDETQPSTTTAIGIHAPGALDDRFHGRGNVSPDVPRSEINASSLTAVWSDC